MAQAIISRKGGGGGGYATITFENVLPLAKTHAPELRAFVYNSAATTVGNYALFGGGITRSGDKGSNSVSNYNSSLVRGSELYLSTARGNLAATTVENYALFGGGAAGTAYIDDVYSEVNAYNTSLTRSTPTSLSQARKDLVATTVGNYALFGGGDYKTSYYSTVDAYNSSLTRSTPTALSVGRSHLAATTVGNYALFGGGNSLSTVDAYNSSLTRSTPTALSVGRSYLATTTVGDYALFGGGNGSSYYSTVDAYNTSLTRTTPTALSVGRSHLAATTVEDYALFAGGYNPYYGGEWNNVSIVDAYNSSLIMTTITSLDYDTSNMSATSIGNYALFGGGRNKSGQSNEVYAYYVNNKVFVYPGTKYKLGSMTDEATSDSMQMITTTAPITGYIKIKDATIN